ncbi:hypothetical protein PFMALIP_05170 [Plasmodium falciparum MaliPS096_E11]|uniref:Uncharacterized protein n=1 Tax=Plasmodium falciparum MaliPS096_E11 TaxID=1036727 RepID=A0A024WJ99_PLAFA|nr:hypothetical protein PFMALIP_05170 [Plasmodium falciparum MaliPS096_E11]
MSDIRKKCKLCYIFNIHKCNISKMIILENMSFGTHFTKTEIYINK